MWPFRGATRPDADWFCAGLSSSFPDLVAQPLLCGGDAAPGCKVFHVPQDKPSEGAEVPVDDVGVDLRDQVLVFRFRGKFHAIEHVRALAASSGALTLGSSKDIQLY